MRPIPLMPLVTGAALAVIALVLWTENDSLQAVAKQGAAALHNAQRDLAQAHAQLAEKARELESTQAALETANAQLAQTRTALPNRSDSTPPSTDPSAPSASPFVKNLFALAQKAADLDRRFKAFPELDIPEIALLTESDWISVATRHPKLETADQVRKALQHVSDVAESKAFGRFQMALANHKNPVALDRIEPLLPELRKKLPEAVIQRYELIPWAQLEPNAPQRKIRIGPDEKPLWVLRQKTTSGQPKEGITAYSNDGKTISAISSPGIEVEDQDP